MTLICYFALQSVSELMDQIPEWLNGGLIAVGCVLPSLGMGLLLNSMGDKKFLPFFFTGFFLVQYMAIDNIALLLIALFLAWFYMTVTKAGRMCLRPRKRRKMSLPRQKKSLLSLPSGISLAHTGAGWHSMRFPAVMNAIWAMAFLCPSTPV